MSKNRYAANIDKNQPDIVKDLRKLGYSVGLNHNDLLVGSRGLTFWYELKSENALDKNGKVREKKVRDSQKKIRATWNGHYQIVSSLDQILDDMKETFKRLGI